MEEWVIVGKFMLFIFCGSVFLIAAGEEIRNDLLKTIFGVKIRKKDIENPKPLRQWQKDLANGIIKVDEEYYGRETECFMVSIEPKYQRELLRKIRSKVKLKKDVTSKFIKQKNDKNSGIIDGINYHCDTLLGARCESFEDIVDSLGEYMNEYLKEIDCDFFFLGDCLILVENSTNYCFEVGIGTGNFKTYDKNKLEFLKGCEDE